MKPSASPSGIKGWKIMQWRAHGSVEGLQILGPMHKGSWTWSVPCFFAWPSISNKNICSCSSHNAPQKAQLTYKPIQRQSWTIHSVGSSLIKDVKTSRPVANPHMKISSSSSTEPTNFPTKTNGWSTVNDTHDVSNKKTMFLLLILPWLCLVLHEVNFPSAMVPLYQNVNSSQK